MKRGIATITATILGVLIVVVGVGILWTGLSPQFGDVKDITDLPDFSIVVSGGYTFYEPELKIASVQIKKGVKKVDVKELQILFSVEGNSYEFRVPIPELNQQLPDINEMKIYWFNFTKEGIVGIPDYVSVAPVFLNGKIGKIISKVEMPIRKTSLSNEEISELEDDFISSYNEEDEVVWGEEDFIFTFYPTYIHMLDDDEHPLWKIDRIDKAMEIGMTHASVLFSDTSDMDIVEQNLKYLRDKNYKISVGFVSSWPLGFFKDGGNDEKFLTAPCLVKSNCSRWNSSFSIDPTYEGDLWNNTLLQIKEIVQKAEPEVVYFDVEKFNNPKTIEYYFKNETCNCSVVEDGIGYELYYDGWLRKGKEMTQAVKEVDENIFVSYYHETPETELRWKQHYKGYYLSSSGPGYWLSGSGDGSGAPLFILPNLELFEKNMETLSLDNALPWVSFNYMGGYSNYNGGWVKFDSSVSREAGRMLRKEGTRGFAVYPSLTEVSDTDYWTEHSREMIEGFKEGLSYVELNKIRNPGFESFKSKADGYKFDKEKEVWRLTGDIRFIPVFWNVTDTRVFEDNSSFIELSKDKFSGMYSWKNTMEGAGNRTITSKEFSISSDEKGNYDFSIYLKSSASQNNPNVEFFVGDEKIGETGITDSWKKFEKIINLDEGTRNLKIVIKDSFVNTKDIFVDDVSLIKI